MNFRKERYLVTSSKLELLNFISSSNLNLIISKKSYYSIIPIVSLVLNEYAINQKKRIYMYCLENSRPFYISNLISLITKIDIHTIHNYNNPCNSYDAIDKNTLKSSEYDNYLNGMKQIIESDLLVGDYTDNFNNHISLKDPLDTILLDFNKNELMRKTEIIIIDSLSLLIEKSKYREEEIFNRIKAYNKKYHTKFLIFDSWNNFTNRKDIDNIVTVDQIKIDDKSSKLILDNYNSTIQIELDDKKIIENKFK